MRESGFVDFHTHTILSDGDLLPAELVQRAANEGCEGLAITDHADASNLDFVISRVLSFVEELGDRWELEVVPGVELTHVPPSRIEAMVKRARDLGARWVAVHGETIVEPVAAGTNRAALDAGADLLAHPGLITEKEAEMAAKRSIYLEITTRKGHSLSNGWVARCARLTGAPILINTDTHCPEDILSAQMRYRCAIGAGLSEHEVDMAWQRAYSLIKSLST